ncbi:hypothetical protein F383_07964 [Gossypium arboreum]|uniref:Uncharacterized protein n=1 Tax=Gossypium arboreum TaxID=29729 RepID=A0A0B0PUK7_GOSAR|nr:hypothetical protein F383_07964 [Gossypium arboreum]
MFLGWQIDLVNSLFLSTRVKIRVCVLVVYDTQLCYTVVCPMVLK